MFIFISASHQTDLSQFFIVEILEIDEVGHETLLVVIGSLGAT